MITLWVAFGYLFQRHQEYPQTPIQFFVLIFHREIGSIIPHQVGAPLVIDVERKN
jgi:hypothetical protein